MSDLSDADMQADVKFGVGLPVGQRRRAYLALAAATVMAVLDTSIANVALPSIGRDLRVTPAHAIWIVSAYQMALTAALFTWSSFAQSRGLAIAWRLGVVIFTCASLCCALAHSLPLLIAARVLQGAGAAAIISITSALLRYVFPREQLGQALGINSMVIAISVAAGPTIGGSILALGPWPWLFFINVPIGIAVVLFTRGSLPNVAGHGAPLHLPSVITSAAGFALLVYGIDGFGRGESHRLIALEILIGAGSFGWFLWRQRSLERPMFAVSLYRRPLFALAATSNVLSFSGSSLATVSLPFRFQVVMGLTPLQSGLLMAAWPVTMGLTANISGRLSDRYPASILSTLGCAALCLGLALYARMPVHASAVAIILHGALCGFGFGLFQAPNSRETMRNVAADESASASAIMASNRIGGQALGAAAVSLIFGIFGATLNPRAAAAVAHGYAATTATLTAGATMALIATLTSSARLWLPRTSEDTRVRAST